MAGFNGSGTFVRVHNWVTDKANTVKVTASRMDAEDDGFATGLSTAICKDGQTTTTAAVPFAVGINISDGSVGTPSLKFISDTDSGFYRIGANNVGLSLGGTKVWDFGTATASAAGSLVLGGSLGVSSIGFGDGSIAAPSVSFSSDPDSGFYSSAANAMGLSLAGSKVIDFNTTGVAVTGTLSASSTLTSTGNFDVNTNKFTVTAASGNTAVAGTLAVTGASTLTGATEVTGAFSVNTNKFTVSAASGNAAVAGTLAVTGNATLTADISAATISGAVVATTANQVTGTAVNLVVTSGRQPYHQSAVKAWITANASGGVNAGYNHTSFTDGGPGDGTAVWAHDFADTSHAPVCSSFLAGAVSNTRVGAIAAGSVQVLVTNGAGSAADPTAYLIHDCGDLA